ncbi:hypothetical protein Pondi_00004 [Escherichia phage Pondi]|nr:hypothetical protein Pondi_00004 [Escherichia phage Pondi]
MYSYDKPLLANYNYSAQNFASSPAITLPASAIAELSHDASRVVEGAVVLGLSGIYTSGTGTIAIGDGTTANRYGVFTVDSTSTPGGPLKGKLVLTEEGYHMGVSNKANTPQVFVLTYSGDAVLASLQLTVGRY